MLRRKAGLLLAILVLILGIGSFIWGAGSGFDLRAAASRGLHLIGEHLWLLFIAIAVLPAFGFPNCPLMIVGGGAAAAVHGSVAATGVAVLAVVTNVVCCYWVAAYPLRAFLWGKIESRAQTRWLARMDERDVTRATLLLHVTPGVPLFIQTYFPGLHRLAYWKYLSIAVPVQALYTALIVYTSGEIFLLIPASTLALFGFGALLLIILANIAREAGWLGGKVCVVSEPR